MAAAMRVRDYDFMIRCGRGHFIKDARSLGKAFIFSGWGMADAFCKACDDDMPVDGHDQMRRLAAAFRREEELEL